MPDFRLSASLRHSRIAVASSQTVSMVSSDGTCGGERGVVALSLPGAAPLLKGSGGNGEEACISGRLDGVVRVQFVQANTQLRAT